MIGVLVQVFMPKVIKSLPVSPPSVVHVLVLAQQLAYAVKKVQDNSRVSSDDCRGCLRSLPVSPPPGELSAGAYGRRHLPCCGVDLDSDTAVNQTASITGSQRCEYQLEAIAA